jgi:hypothetical protein
MAMLKKMPIAFYEILELAARGESAQIVPLIQSVIRVTQADPDALSKLPHVAEGGTV